MHKASVIFTSVKMSRVRILGLMVKTEYGQGFFFFLISLNFSCMRQIMICGVIMKTSD